LKRLQGQGGQLLVGVIIMVILLMIMVPALVTYVQNETRWSMKQDRATVAFQLAEAAIDRGFRKISESTSTWSNCQEFGTIPSGYLLATSYNDLGITGGYYTIGISSGPETEEVTIIGIGKYAPPFGRSETRGLIAVFANAPMGDVAIRGQSTIDISGSQAIVHWGSIVSPKAITQSLSAGSEGKFPQYWSASSITMDPDGSGPIICDSPNCHQWHSYQSNIPADPGIDTGAYADSATLTNTYYTGNQTWGGNDNCGTVTNPCSKFTTCCDDGYSYYINGNLTVNSTIFIKGNLVVTGNVSLPNGLAGLGDIWTPLPQNAWKQYGNSYTTYSAGVDDDNGGGNVWDPTAPASFPGINSNYKSPANRLLRLKKVMVEGFLYVGGNLTQGAGGGDEKVVGSIFVGGTIDIDTNNFSVYYSESAGRHVKTTQIVLSRVSWKDKQDAFWPSGL
jgi:hypothetical protein